MFVAAGLLCANVQVKETDFTTLGMISGLRLADAYGWPFIAYHNSNEAIVQRLRSQLAGGVSYCPIWSLPREICYFGLLGDLAVTVAALGGTWALCEWRIRRKERLNLSASSRLRRRCSLPIQNPKSKIQN